LTPEPAPVFEQHGIESIPDRDRSASVFDFARLCWGGANSLATAVLGAFPIMFGLSFWQAMAAILLGVLLGSLVLAPMSVFGPLTGTNNAVSSSAHFGVVGRIVGSFLSLLTAVAFFSISVWSSGDAVIGAAHALFQLPETEGWFALAYGVFGASILIVCIYGFRLMLLVNKIAVVASSLLFIVGVIAFWSRFDAGFGGSQLAWGSAAFWPAFVSASLVALSNPISFGAFLGDWSRYVPRSTPRGTLIAATILAQLATLLPFAFGAMTASIIATQAPSYLERVDYAGGLLAVAPAWFFTPLFVLALLSGMSTGTTSLYGTGLDFSSVIPRLCAAHGQHSRALGGTPGRTRRQLGCVAPGRSGTAGRSVSRAAVCISGAARSLRPRRAALRARRGRADHAGLKGMRRASAPAAAVAIRSGATSRWNSGRWAGALAMRSPSC
jgi:purine-cytosine permease-like protein